MNKVARCVARLLPKTAALATEKEIRVRLGSVPEEIIKDSSTVKTRITQGFIAKIDGGTDVRIRKTEQDGKDPEYTMTCKYRPLFQEAETEISQEMFDNLAPFAESMQVKDRYVWKGWDIDHVLENASRPQNVGEVWAEYELSENSGIPKIPECFKVDVNVKDAISEIEAEAENLSKQGLVKQASLLDGFLNELGL